MREYVILMAFVCLVAMVIAIGIGSVVMEIMHDYNARILQLMPPR